MADNQEYCEVHEVTMARGVPCLYCVLGQNTQRPVRTFDQILRDVDKGLGATGELKA